MEEFEKLIKSLLVEIMSSQEAETLQDALTIVKTIKKDIHSKTIENSDFYMAAYERIENELMIISEEEYLETRKILLIGEEN